MKTAIIVFARLPQPGKVKTRLIPDVGEARATGLYECFVGDVIDQAHRVAKTTGASLRLMITPEEGLSYFSRAYGGLDATMDVKIEAQQGHTLGNRLDHAFRRVLDSHDGAVVIGTDLPSLEDEILEEAVRKLAVRDAVIGPAEDGGYYLLGLRQANSMLFEGIAWSTDTVFAETVHRFKKLKLSFDVLPTRYDIDTIDEIRRLKMDLAGSVTPSRTKLFLNELSLGIA